MRRCVCVFPEDMGNSSGPATHKWAWGQDEGSQFRWPKGFIWADRNKSFSDPGTSTVNIAVQHVIYV